MKKKLIVVCAALVLVLFVVFAMPFPFIGTLWENDIARNRMVAHVRWTVVGLHRDEIVLMLGEPDFNSSSRGIAYCINHPVQWRRLVIFTDENGIATRTLIGNPLHFGVY